MVQRRQDSIFGPAMLAWESQQVIALRMAKLAFGGPAAAIEVQRMVNEKMDAVARAASMFSAAAMRGNVAGAAPAVTTMLRHRVRANRRRLSKLP